MSEEGKGMFELFEKAISTGFEIQGKVVDSLGELVAKGKISDEDKDKFIKELDDKLLETKNKGEELVNGISNKLSEKNPIVTKGDIEALDEKIQKLEKKVKEQAKKISALEGVSPEKTKQA